MARQSGFKVEGVRQMVRDLEAIGADVEDLKDTFQAISQEGTQVAKGLVPVKSGRLQASLRGNRAKSKAVVTAGGASVPYAGAINYGWPARNIEPALFMQQTDEQFQDRALSMLEQGIDDVIQKRGLLG